MAALPTKPFEVRQHLLERAGRLLGRSNLAVGLKVSEDELENYISGRKPLPGSKLAPLVSLLSKFAQDRGY